MAEKRKRIIVERMHEQRFLLNSKCKMQFELTANVGRYLGSAHFNRESVWSVECVFIWWEAAGRPLRPFGNYTFCKNEHFDAEKYGNGFWYTYFVLFTGRVRMCVRVLTIILFHELLTINTVDEWRKKLEAWNNDGWNWIIWLWCVCKSGPSGSFV